MSSRNLFLPCFIEISVLNANSVDPDQMPPHSVASDQGLHSLPMSLSGEARLKWVKALSRFVADNILILIFLFFRENKTCLADDSYEMSNLIFSENKKKIYISKCDLL